MATLVIRYPDGTQHEQEVGEQLTIGRAEGNDLVLSEGGVSRQHARFFIEGATLMLEDSGSANGTFVDGQLIDKPVTVSGSAQVVIGDYEISIKPVKKVSAPPSSREKKNTKMVRAAGPSVQASDAAKRPRSTSAPGGPHFRGVGAPVEGLKVPLAATMTVGRVATCDLHLDDESVSRRHAQVRVSARGDVFLKDFESANGTAVNGEVLKGETQLQPGDVVQFGVVEFVFQSGVGAQRPSTPYRVPGSNAVVAGGDSGDASKRRLLIAATAVVALLVLLVVIKVVWGHRLGPTPVPSAPVESQAPVVDNTALIESLMTRARTEIEREEWGRVDETLRKVLEIEPLHDEARELRERVAIDKKCFAAIKKGESENSLHNFEEALTAYGQVTQKCSKKYFLQVLRLVKEPRDEMLKRTGEDCQRFSRDSKWQWAKKACEAHMRLACQTLEPDVLNPPPGAKVRFDSGKLRDGEWRPSSASHLSLLKARQGLKEPLGPTLCPDIPALRPPPPPPDPTKDACAEFAKRYPDPAFGEAMCEYFKGRPIATFARPLQTKVIESRSKEALIDLARDVIKELGQAYNYYENGTTALANDQLPKAADLYRRALEYDERIVLGPAPPKSPEERKRQLELKTSYVRRQIIDNMGTAAYQKGKEKADHNDRRAACKTWKIGGSISRTKPDLLRAMATCSGWAHDRLADAKAANTCEAYKLVLDFAVDGDGAKEEVMAITDKMDCQLEQ